VASRPYIDIPLGAYEPDWGGIPRPDVPGYLVDAVNVRSTNNGWRGMPTFSDIASATAIGSSLTAARGWASYTSSTNNFFVVNQDGEIYESRSEGTDTWQNVSPAAGTVDHHGDFVRFDDDAVYVSASRAPISKTLTATHATLFASLAGSPPTGICAARVRNHLVIGGISTYDVRTSAFGDHTDWPTPGTADARAKQSISESLNPEFGGVFKILGGEKFGIILQDQALTRMTYVGGSAVYEFDTFFKVDSIGFAASAGFFGRPVTDGRNWYFYNRTGVYVTDGYTVSSLSEGRLNEALFLNSISHPLGSSGVESAFTSAYDARRRMVLFSGAAYSGATTYQLAYHVPTGAFSHLQHTARTAFFDAQFSNRDVYNINATNRKLQKLSTGGTPTIAMQTGYIEIDPGYRIQLHGAHILGTGTGSLTLAYKTAATSAACDVSQSSFTSMTAAGLGQKKTARGSAQYIAFRITGTGAESQLIRGIRVYYERAEPSP
jgi:hypothetical protein